MIFRLAKIKIPQFKPSVFKPRLLSRFEPLLKAVLLSSLLGASGLLSAATLSGVVTNGTTNKASAGDDVILIKLAEGMQEVGRTTTDARGHFSLELPDDGAPHLVRVNHQNVNYHHPAPPGTATADVQVFDSSPKVEGITANVDIVRLQADNGALQAIEMYAVKNASSPPRTKMSDHTFEVYLPDGAQLDSSLAAGPGGMPVSSAPVPTGEKGRYAFVFPLRPGETKFQLAYHLPYSGSVEFHPKVLLPVTNLVVMMPKSMQFKSSEAAFQNAPEEGGMAVYVASGVGPGQNLAFNVSGTGSIPRETQEPGAAANTQNQAPGMPGGDTAPGSRPGGGLGAPEDKPDPLHNFRWYILGVMVVILAGGAYYTLGRQRDPALADGMVPPASSGADVSGLGYGRGSEPMGAPPSSTSHSATLMAALKEELFQLETERLRKRISEEEYTRARAALELTLQRALTRTS